MSVTPENEHPLSRRRLLALLGASAVVPFVACTKTPSSPAIATAASSVGDAGLYYLTLHDVARRIEARELSPVDLTQRLLERIAAVDPSLKSYATVLHDQALADAQSAAQEIQAGRYRGPLHGVPVAVKDLCYTKGVRTMGGSAVLKNFVPDFDGTVVALLRDAGAVLLGKLTLTEGATAGYGPAMDVPRNPWNTDYWPGLSSSGSGVALAAGLCYAAIGTDTGGSIRYPSSANGVVGLKPTYGRVSRYGVLTFADSLDHVGPMGRTVADVAVIFDAIAGKDPHDQTTIEAPAPDASRWIGRGIRGLRIGVDRKYALEGIDQGDAAALEEALRVLARLGAQVVDVRMPDLASLLPTWQTIAGAELVEAHRATYPSRASEYGPYIREFLEGGTHVTPQQLAQARQARAAFNEQFVRVLESVDAMACPAGGAPAWRITRETQVGSLGAFHAAWSAAAPRAMDFTGPMNLAGTPAICLPSGFSPDGLPYSIQFAGRALSEPVLCRIAAAYEQATGWHNRHPRLA
jgi:amidase